MISASQWVEDTRTGIDRQEVCYATGSRRSCREAESYLQLGQAELGAGRRQPRVARHRRLAAAAQRHALHRSRSLRSRQTSGRTLRLDSAYAHAPWCLLGFSTGVKAHC